MADLNLLLNVHCPHCGKALLVAISGFAGELVTRHKECKFCGQPYHVHMVTMTSAADTPADGEIAEAKNRIAYLREQRKQTLADLLIRREIGLKLYHEALDMAREMRAKHESN